MCEWVGVGVSGGGGGGGGGFVGACRDVLERNGKVLYRAIRSLQVHTVQYMVIICLYTVESALLGRRLSGSAALLGHFTWNGITSVRMCTKLHRLIGSNIRFIGPVNSEPHVHTSKICLSTKRSHF